MKRKKSIILLIITALCVVIGFNSCGDPMSFDSSLLIGKWRKTSKYDSTKYEYYRFDAGGNGATWDEGDDVSENEAQPFTWTLTSTGDFTLLHKGEMGQVVPKTYTMLTLTATTLSFKDSYGERYTYYK
ncbi:MAG: hypothetical protein LBS50_08910 [Prevotellaceae bacterium]|jgi:hypothetical protein|nr:hypothetical protein [Prevotellaceae bacterium]